MIVQPAVVLVVLGRREWLRVPVDMTQQWWFQAADRNRMMNIDIVQWGLHMGY